MPGAPFLLCARCREYIIPGATSMPRQPSAPRSNCTRPQIMCDPLLPEPKEPEEPAPPSNKVHHHNPRQDEPRGAKRSPVHVKMVHQYQLCGPIHFHAPHRTLAHLPRALGELSCTMHLAKLCTRIIIPQPRPIPQTRCPRIAPSHFLNPYPRTILAPVHQPPSIPNHTPRTCAKSSWRALVHVSHTLAPRPPLAAVPNSTINRCTV
jgi:hypothetical protein